MKQTGTELAGTWGCKCGEPWCSSERGERLEHAAGEASKAA